MARYKLSARTLPCLAFALFTLIVAAETQPLVEVKEFDVKYRGIANDGVEKFLGIHYGQDTSGENRFRAPKPYVPEKGTVVDATERGLPCSQPKNDVPPYIVGRGEVGEDCLTLSIARPEGVAADAKLPVIVWIFGGAYMLGAGDDPLYDPTAFIKHSASISQPVIYATLNYRLGIFGFANSPSMSLDNSTNTALRDQRLALNWLRTHVASFGGDPSRIMVYGQSAGGTSMALQTLAWGGRDIPFHAALTMSGPPGNCFNMSRDTTRLNTAAVAARFDCLDAAGLADLDCLRKVPHSDLNREQIEYAHTLHPPFGTFVYLPVVDDDLFTAPPSQLIRSGAVANISFVKGFVHDEAGAIIGPNPNILDDASVAAAVLELFPTLSQSHADKLLELYPVKDFEAKSRAASAGAVSPHWFRTAAIMNDFIVRCPDIDFAWNYHRAFPDSLRMYNFNQTAFQPLLDAMGLPHLGVIHGSEIPYSRGVIPEGNTESLAEHELLAAKFMTAIIALASTGDPSSIDAFGAWPLAFAGSSTDGLDPTTLDIQVIGGELGSGVSRVHSGSLKEIASGMVDAARSWAHEAGVLEGGMPWEWDYQRVVGSFGAMSQRKEELRRRDMQEQKLLERCKYVNSLAGVNGV